MTTRKKKKWHFWYKPHWLVGSALTFVLFCGSMWIMGHSYFSNYPTPILDPYVLAHEGGFSNDAHDPGGRTLNGIIQSEYNRYRDEKEKPRQLLRAAMLKTPEWIVERDEIYLAKYCNSLGVRCLDMPSGMDYVMFDYGVNSGVGRSGKVLRGILHFPTNTWHITDDVLAKAKEYPVHRLIDAMVDEREDFLKGLRTCQYFCKGWLARTRSVRANAHVMAGRPRGKEMEEDLIPAFGPGKAFDDPELEMSR